MAMLLFPNNFRMELLILEHCAKRDRERAAEKKADIAAAYPANPSESAMKVEWDVKIERGRKSSTSKSGSKSLERDRLERERLALEMAEKVSLQLNEYGTAPYLIYQTKT